MAIRIQCCSARRFAWRMYSSAAGTRLATAAEELVQAALSETISANQLVVKEAALDIKKLVEETNKLVGQVGEAKESSDAKLNTATQRLLNLETKMSSIETRMSSIEARIARTDKARRIEWAIDHVKSIRIPSHRVGHEFLLEVLLSFRRDQGHYITDSEQHFRDTVQTHLHTLLGVKPRLAVEENGKCAIFYS